ncbi:glutathione S-transferase tau 3 [Actinidia rufa]|uniref:glutathione transferase n=1 Tax=Actinidia rufa TaxID=165716 RepID=A0A7J0EY94_9ERIC|nr:glutathione S-transferase tau 3 [Actinidia rufa]
MSNVQEVKLLGAWPSAFVQRIKWALNLKGIEYEYLEQDLFNKGTLLIQCNPVHKKVPVLIHNDRPIAESLIILEYLDETWKNRPLLPQDPYQRAMARFWAKFVDDKVCTLPSYLGTDPEPWDIERICSYIAKKFPEKI